MACESGRTGQPFVSARVLLATAFLMARVGKLSGRPMMAEMFETECLAIDWRRRLRQNDGIVSVPSGLQNHDPKQACQNSLRFIVRFLLSLPERSRLRQNRRPANRSIRRPADGVTKEVKSYVELDPLPGYEHAWEAAYEAFYDLKYGVRIHWSVYSIDGPRDRSWPFLKLSNKQKQRYQGFTRLGTRKDSTPIVDGNFDRCGFHLMAFTAKHHDGFSMFDTKTRVHRRAVWTGSAGRPQIEPCDLAYSIMESPFHRDVVKELCTAAREHGIKIDLYFSHPDWYDAEFRDLPFSPIAALGKETAAERTRMLQRHRQQLRNCCPITASSTRSASISGWTKRPGRHCARRCSNCGESSPT